MRQEDREKAGGVTTTLTGLRKVLAAAGLESLWQIPGWQPAESIRLLPLGARTAPARGASKFGGDPDLPSGAVWPLIGKRALSFLAQIHLPDLKPFAAASGLPKRGQLWFFADTLDIPRKGGSACRVIYSTAATATLRSASPPVDASSTPLSDIFPVRAMRFQSILSVPERIPESLDPELREALMALINPEGIVHKIFGYPNRIQNPLTGKAGSETLLLQLDSDRRLDMQWGDAGRLFLMSSGRDPGGTEFNNCSVAIQSY
ncbi:MAG: YwqG family protein [Fibrobacteria bacterium]